VIPRKPDTTEIAIVGAGPAGVAAAVTAARAGASVTVLDEYARPGGQYYKQPVHTDGGPSYPHSLASTIQQGRELLEGLSHPGIDLQCNTLAWNISADELVLDLYSPAGARALQAQRIILCAGATERAVPFPGWTLPGVIMAGAGQLMLKAHGLLPGKTFLLAGTGPLLQLAAVQLLEAGAQIAALVELRSRTEFLKSAAHLWRYPDKLGQGFATLQKLLQARVPIKFGHTIAQALGETEVSGAVIMRVDGDGQPIPGSETRFEVDTICLNYGFTPATELPRIAGCEQYFDQDYATYATATNDSLETSIAGILAAGETRGMGGAEVAVIEGQLAGSVAAQQLGFSPPFDQNGLSDKRLQARAVAASLGKMFQLKPGLCALAADDVPVCRCEEVSAGEVRAAIRNGVVQLNQLKPWTRAGMGRCQGRICGDILRQIVAAETGLPLSEIQPFTARAPVKPVPLEVVGGPVAETDTLTWEDHVGGYGVART
jgi:thioredoxin reductase/bacterioferritin-associated ferredoxin